MKKRHMLAVAGWFAAATAATGAGVAVVGFVGGGLAGPTGQVLSAAEVRQALSAPVAGPGPSAPVPSSGPATPAPSSVSPSAPPKPQVTQVINTAGGTVVARCEAGQVTLRSWTPAQGFEVDDVERGPAERARVEFETEHDEIKVEVRCDPRGRPVHTLSRD